MKAFVFVLLCALVAVQGRHTGVQQSASALAALGDNPWLVHLRIAVSTSGLLDSCTGSLIDSRWVLTAASCVTDVRFVWIRYGVVNVISPSLVTETSAARIHSDNRIALVSINRAVETTAVISPVGLATEAEVAESATYCTFGEDDSGNPGEELSCSVVSVAVQEDGSLDVSSEGFEVASSDVGGALVSDGVQYAVLTSADGDFLEFTPISSYVEWIESETGVTFSPDSSPETAPEAVNFVY